MEGHRNVIGGRVTLTGMRKEKELEGKTREAESIMEDQGKARVRCGLWQRVLGRRRSSGHQDSHWGAAPPVVKYNDGVRGMAVDRPPDPPAQWK